MPIRSSMIVGGVAFVGILAAVLGSYYTISPREIGVVTRWGQIIHDHQTPGLHFKIPFIDTVHYMPVAV
jgi:membrane protease subunit HflC